MENPMLRELANLADQAFLLGLFLLVMAGIGMTGPI